MISLKRREISLRCIFFGQGYYDEDETETSETTDSPSEATSDRDKLRQELKDRYGYDEMSDEQKRAFDEKLDEVVGAEDSGDDDPGENEIGAKVLRRSR